MQNDEVKITEIDLSEMEEMEEIITPENQGTTKCCYKSW